MILEKWITTISKNFVFPHGKNLQSLNLKKKSKDKFKIKTKYTFDKRALNLLHETLRSSALFFIGIYRSVFTAHFGAGVCRFEPSCSAYANQAFNSHSPFKALKLSFFRLLKCRPGSSFGYDPVPPAETKINLNQQIHGEY